MSAETHPHLPDRCLRTRQLLLSSDSPGGGTAERLSAERHRADCRDCRDFLRDVEVTARAIAGAATRPAMPSRMRSRVFATLAEHRRRRVLAMRALTATLVLAAASLVAVALYRGDSQTLVAALAEDHFRLEHSDAIETSDPVRLASWARQHTSVAPEIPVIEGHLPQGARLCLVKGRRGLVLRYRIGDHIVSYYLMPSPSGDEVDPNRAIHELGHAGYHAASWRRAGVLHALVSDLPRERLMGLANACAVAASGDGETSRCRFGHRHSRT